MAAKSPKVALILLFIHACLAVLVPTGLAQLPQIPGLFPFPGLGGLPGPTTQCFSSLVNIPGCLTEVFGSFINGHFGIIGSACCKAITEIEDNCLGRAAPSPLGTDQTVESNLYARATITFPRTITRAIRRIYSPTFVPLQLSPSSSMPGLLLPFPGLSPVAIRRRHSTMGKFGVSGLACCKAITDVSDKCWPKMFPLNPMFPPLLKSNCAPVVRAAPTT
uniref:Prolamin-like domain-containing protein n=1 Tax=Fagus sylvatica TaxID=28930 RepID=A0A2N9IAT3_FAGSY